MTDDFDFGFTAVDEIPASEPKQPVQAEVSSDQMDSIMDKLEQLESRILSADNSGMINSTIESLMSLTGATCKKSFLMAVIDYFTETKV